MQFDPLVVYLLAAPHPEGGTAPLCRLGIYLVTIPLFPPATTIAFTVFPIPGTFCMVNVGFRFSPSMVPGAFQVTATWAGSQNPLAAPLNSLLILEGCNMWAEIRSNEPFMKECVNMSGLAQFWESMFYALILQNESDYRLMKKLAADWGGRR